MGLITVIVDVIDMSTSLEAARQGGALLTLGASPIKTNCPVAVNPLKVASFAGKYANKHQTEIIIISEPRIASPAERNKTAAKIIEHLAATNGKIYDIIPNIGGEIGKLTDFKGKVVIAVTATGGTAFDAAFNILQDERVTTGTIARVSGYRSGEVIRLGLKRILEYAHKYQTGIGFVAASKNSTEDVLAAQYLAWQLLLLKN